MSVKNSQAWRARRKVLTESILTMYTSSATSSELDRAFQSFHPQVVFQDPIVRVQGQDKYQAQFRTLRDLFKEFKPLSVEMTGDYDVSIRPAPPRMQHIHSRRLKTTDKLSH